MNSEEQEKTEVGLEFRPTSVDAFLFLFKTTARLINDENNNFPCTNCEYPNPLAEKVRSSLPLDLPIVLLER